MFSFGVILWELVHSDTTSVYPGFTAIAPFAIAQVRGEDVSDILRDGSKV